jgi:hypothetical protein
MHQKAYPAPAWNIGRVCVRFNFSILYLGTISDFTANSESMALFASLSSMLKLFTPVSLFLGLSTILSFTLLDETRQQLLGGGFFAVYLSADYWAHPSK